MPETLFLTAVAFTPEIAAAGAPLAINAYGAAFLAGPTIFETLAASGALAFAGKAALSIGLSVGINYALGALNQKDHNPVQRNDITIKQAVPARFIDIGRVKTGGALFFYESPDSYLYIGKILSAARIAAVEAWYYNDTLATLSSEPFTTGASVTNGTWANLVNLEARLGATGQAVSNFLFNNFSGYGMWLSTDRLAGLPWAVTRYQQVPKAEFVDKYPNGPPDLTAVIRGAPLPDPRNPAHDLKNPDSWTGFDNAACAVLRYCIDPDGWGLDPADFDVTDAANACDAAVPIPGGSEARYRSWGRWSTQEERRRVLADLLESMDGRLIEQRDGKARLFAGAPPDPLTLKTLHADNILSITIEPKGDPLDRAGIARVRFVSSAHNYMEQQAPDVILAGGDPGAAPEVEEMALRFCPSEFQGQRLGKIRLHQRAPDWTASGVANLAALDLVGERFCRLVLPELELDATFELGGIGLDLTNATVAFKLQSVPAGMFDIAASAYGTLSAIATVPFDQSVPEPTNVAAVLTDAGATYTLSITWTEVTGFTYEVEYRELDPPLAWTPSSDDTSPAVITGLNEKPHDARVRTVGERGTSDWVTVTATGP